MHALILILATAMPCQAPKTQAPAESGKKAEASTSTPEETYREFMIAMVNQNEPRLRELTLPNDDFEWLLKGTPLTLEQLAAYKEQVEKMTIRNLKVGEEVTLPGNRKYKVPAADVTDDRAVVMPEGAPTPARLKKVEGHWKVDASPYISGRKAADAARKKAQKTAK
jgi:hypothetical protein